MKNWNLMKWKEEEKQKEKNLHKCSRVTNNNTIQCPEKLRCFTSLCDMFKWKSSFTYIAG